MLTKYTSPISHFKSKIILKVKVNEHFPKTFLNATTFKLLGQKADKEIV